MSVAYSLIEKAITLLPKVASERELPVFQALLNYLDDPMDMIGVFDEWWEYKNNTYKGSVNFAKMCRVAWRHAYFDHVEIKVEGYRKAACIVYDKEIWSNADMDYLDAYLSGTIREYGLQDYEYGHRMYIALKVKEANILMRLNGNQD